MPDRCTVLRFRVGDIAGMAADPALNKLLEDGWTMLTNIVVQDGGEPEIHIVMQPPCDASHDFAHLRKIHYACIALLAIQVVLLAYVVVAL